LAATFSIFFGLSTSLVAAFGIAVVIFFGGASTGFYFFCGGDTSFFGII
jgi:hypothetical protein